ncbi:MAG: leucyl aminopeptidase [Gammaproteobacteria bacterium]|nr:leucyl aminopeptidase [Gammaproteobacteria bacterium]
MQYKISTRQVTQLDGDCTLLAIFSDAENGLAIAGKSASAYDKELGGQLEDLIAQGDLKGTIGETCLVPMFTEDAPQRLMLVGCGKKSEFKEKQLRNATAAAVKAAKKTRSKHIVNALTAETVRGAKAYNLARASVEECETALYHYTTTLSKKDQGAHHLVQMTLLVSNAKSASDARKGAKHGAAIGNGVNFAKELGNLPGNYCTPSYLEQTAKAMAKDSSKLSVKVLQEKDMEKLGMGALLSVSRGSREPAKMIIFTYNGGNKSQKPHVLVGKGLTFDAGGISLKPPGKMDEMKYDMCGGASVFGTIKAAVEMNLKLNIIGIVPASENLPDGAANKPGDVVTNMEGITIEILNTDAEGRLILCDALSYAKRFEPETIIDMATLTGACVIALGAHHSALLSKDDKLAAALLKAGDSACDKAWRLPLSPEYHEQLKTNFADVANVGGRPAGSITAASFLSMFTEGMRWAHLDIAGSAWKDGAAKGATGRPVPLLCQYLLDLKK